MNIQTFEKAKRVIDSCVNYVQLLSAEKYCELYYNMYEDFSRYRQLLMLVEQKGNSLL
jgi:hypothetical protein